MMAFALAVLLLLASLVGVTLEKAYFYLPARELKRRAERGDRLSAALYSAAAYESELRVLLIAVTVIAAAGGLALFNLVAPFMLGFLVTALALTLCFFWQPRTRLAPWEAKLAARSSPWLAWLLVRLHPLLACLSPLNPVPRRHTSLFELADLDELFARQLRQRDNRMRAGELERLRNVLRIGSYRVRDVMVRAKDVVSVSEEEAVSPVLVDSLHRSGYLYFSVYEGKKSNIVGTLALHAIADVRQHGTVRDNTDHHLAYVHEDDSLEQVLRALYETHQHLFIVVNASGGYVGIVTIADIIKRLFGALEHAAFGKHEDRDAVAGRYATHPAVAKKETEVVQ